MPLSSSFSCFVQLHHRILLCPQAGCLCVGLFLAAVALALSPSVAEAHCDSLQGPVVVDACLALERGEDDADKALQQSSVKELAQQMEGIHSHRGRHPPTRHARRISTLNEPQNKSSGFLARPGVPGSPEHRPERSSCFLSPLTQVFIA